MEIKNNVHNCVKDSIKDYFSYGGEGREYILDAVKLKISEELNNG